MRGFAQSLLWSSESCARFIIQPGLITKDHRPWASGLLCQTVVQHWDYFVCPNNGQHFLKNFSEKKCIVMSTPEKPSGVCVCSL